MARIVCNTLGADGIFVQNKVPRLSPVFIDFHFFKDFFMTLNLSIGPLVSLIAGILILVMPRLLSTIVAVYLIIMGVIGLLGLHALRF
jgi:hypothetical protein